LIYCNAAWRVGGPTADTARQASTYRYGDTLFFKNYLGRKMNSRPTQKYNVCFVEIALTPIRRCHYLWSLLPKY